MSLETETKESELKEKVSDSTLDENIQTNDEDTIIFQKLSNKTIKNTSEESIKKEPIEEFLESKQNIETQLENINLIEEDFDQTVQSEKTEKKFNNYEKNSKTKYNNYSENTKKSKKKILTFILIFVVLLLFLLLFSTIFALLNSNNNKILNNITVYNIDISNLTELEAKEKLTKEFNSKLSSTYTLNYEDYETTFVPTDIDASFDIDNVVKEAYKIGRDNNIFINNYEIISTLLSTKELKPELNYDKEKLETILKNINLNLPGLVTQPSYYLDKNNLIITKGTSGISLQNEKLESILIGLINSSNKNNNTVINIPVQTTEPNDIDIEKIHTEIYKEPKDAYIIKEPFELHLDEDGVDFALSMEEVKKILEEDHSEYSIPLKFSKAKVTINDLGEDAFPHNLGSFSSRFDESNVNRSTNVKLATKKINGTILKPGEVFSFNTVVGRRTAANGFKEATVFVNGSSELGIGGGICQVSSTLYNSVIFANLEIVERTNHSLPVSYVPAGRDATVSYGTIDFKFKNNRSYPIKIQATASSGLVKISILGIKEAIEYNVSFQTQKLNTIPFKTEYINDSSLPSGKQVVKQSGSNGSKYATYKILTLNGAIVKKELLSTDTYIAKKKIVRVGTGKTSTPSTSVDTSTPSSTTNSGSQSSGGDITITY